MKIYQEQRLMSIPSCMATEHQHQEPSTIKKVDLPDEMLTKTWILKSKLSES